MNKHIGSSLDDWFKEEGFFEEFEAERGDNAMSKPRREPNALVPILPNSPPTNICLNCEHWARLKIQKTPTSFGTCGRWSDLTIEDRGGVQATPYTPTTPSGASCEEFSQYVDR